jgi:pyruvate dehydrogenase E2 component (dihydrolipoamide acetyltransferase)
MVSDTREGVLFRMPSLGADMTEGRITEWLIQPGDHVERGQIVVVVETDKSDIEVEVFEPATVVELLVGEGEMVAVGTPIAEFAGTEADVRSTPPAPIRQPEPKPESKSGPGPESKPGPESAHVTSPVIRHLAEQLHVDPARLHGTGPGGRVHRDDVEAAANVARRPRITPRARRLLHERGIDPAGVADQGYITGDHVLAMRIDTTAGPAEPALPTEPTTKPTRTETMRRHIADLMSRSWAEIPHFHVSRRLDLGPTTAGLALYNEQRALTDRVVPGALLLCAAARAAAKVGACNGWWRDERFEPATDVRLGVVLSLRTGGIIVPTIERADQLTPGEMMARLTELVQRARQGRLRASDLAEATITVTNLGDLGADAVAGVIHPPQVAIVGFGAIHDEVLPVDERATIRPVVHASLAGDHRAIDGVTGSRYLAQLQTLLGGPLLEEL